MFLAKKLWKMYFWNRFLRNLKFERSLLDKISFPLFAIEVYIRYFLPLLLSKLRRAVVRRRPVTQEVRVQFPVGPFCKKSLLIHGL